MLLNFAEQKTPCWVKKKNHVFFVTQQLCNSDTELPAVTDEGSFFQRSQSKKLNEYCNFTNFRCVNISVASDRGAFGGV